MRTIGVVGLGYVGLPLAVAFGKKYRTIGYDLSGAKVEAYRRHQDPTGEVSSTMLTPAAGLPMLIRPPTAPFTSSPVDGNIHDLVTLGLRGEG